MKVVLEFQFPIEPFNSLVKAGKAGETMQKVLGAIKADAVYFTARDGNRGGIAIVDLNDASKIPSLAEPFFLSFNAAVRVLPCMTAEDLGKAGLDDIGKAFR